MPLPASGKIDVAIPGDSHRQDEVKGMRRVFPAKCLCLLVRKIFPMLPLLSEQTSPHWSGLYHRPRLNPFLAKNRNYQERLKLINTHPWGGMGVGVTFQGRWEGEQLTRMWAQART